MGVNRRSSAGPTRSKSFCNVKLTPAEVRGFRTTRGATFLRLVCSDLHPGSHNALCSCSRRVCVRRTKLMHASNNEYNQHCAQGPPPLSCLLLIASHSLSLLAPPAQTYPAAHCDSLSKCAALPALHCLGTAALQALQACPRQSPPTQRIGSAS